MKSLLISLLLVFSLGCYENTQNDPESIPSGITAENNETEYSICDLKAKEVTIQIEALQYSNKTLHNIENAYTDNRILSVYVRCDAGWSQNGGDSYNVDDLSGSFRVEKVHWKDDYISISRVNYSGTSIFKLFIIYK